jgi:hypothetical protein
VPFIGTAIAQATGISLSALLHPMAIAAIGIIVSYVFNPRADAQNRDQG